MEKFNYYEELLSQFNLNTFGLFDYFTRLTNADINVLQEIINKVFIDRESFTDEYGNNFIIVNHNYQIYLNPENTGYYINSYISYLPTPQISGILSPQLLLSSNETQGANIFFLLKSLYGINDNNSIYDICRRINFIYDIQDRILLYRKYHSYSSIFQNIANIKYPNSSDININDSEQIYSENMEFYPYPIYYGYKRNKIYWYKTEDSSIIYGIIYFFNEYNIPYKLPISSWKFIPYLKYHGVTRPNNINEKSRLDLLLPPPPFILYNIDKIKSSDSHHVPIIIFPDELEIDKFIDKYDPSESFFIPTTWFGGLNGSISKTDWEYINGRNIYILLDDRDMNNFKINIIKSYLIFTTLKDRGIKIQGYINYSKLSEFNQNPNILSINTLDKVKMVEWAYKDYGIVLDETIIDYSLSINQLLEKKQEEDISVFNNLLELSEQMMIFGSRGSGKSYLSYLLAISLATGQPLLKGFFSPTRSFKVLYIDGEMSERLIARRVKEICAGLAISPPKIEHNLKFLIGSNFPGGINLSEAKIQKHYQKSINEAEIIILDSVNFLFPSAMGNSADSSKPLIDFILYLRNRNKSAIIIDHDSSKSSGKSKSIDSFGTSAKSFPLDLIFKIENHSGQNALICTKARSHALEKLRINFTVQYNNSDNQIQKLIFKVITDKQKISPTTSSLEVAKNPKQKKSKDDRLKEICEIINNDKEKLPCLLEAVVTR